MNNRFLILIILVGLIGVSAWYLMKGQSQTPTLSPTPSSLNEEHLLCSGDEECIRFQQTCDDCDCGIAINQEYRAIYQKEKSLRCKINGPATLCSIYCTNAPKCIENRCVMVEKVQEDLPPALTAPSEPVETIGEPPPPPAPKGPSVEELQGTWKLEKELNLNFTTGQFEEQASLTCKRNCHFIFKGNDVCFKDALPPQGLPLLCLDEDYLPFTISGNMLSWSWQQSVSTWEEVEIKNGKLEILYPSKTISSLKRIFVKVE